MRGVRRATPLRSETVVGSVGLASTLRARREVETNTIFQILGIMYYSRRFGSISVVCVYVSVAVFLSGCD